jgi:hypothetical protein
MTTLASYNTHSATQTSTDHGQDSVSLVASEVQPSALPRRNPRLQEGLRKRSTARCGYVYFLFSRLA